MACKNEHKGGSIYFWDHEVEGLNRFEGDTGNMIEIARNFSEFLSQLVANRT